MHAYVRFIEDGKRIILPVASIKKFDPAKPFDPLQKYKMKWTDNMYYEGTIIFTSESYQAAEDRLERKRAIIPNTALPLKSCLDSTDDNLDDVKPPCRPDVDSAKLTAMKQKLKKLASDSNKKFDFINSDDISDATIKVETMSQGAIAKKKLLTKTLSHSVKVSKSSKLPDAGPKVLATTEPVGLRKDTALTGNTLSKEKDNDALKTNSGSKMLKKVPKLRATPELVELKEDTAVPGNNFPKEKDDDTLKTDGVPKMPKKKSKVCSTTEAVDPKKDIAVPGDNSSREKDNVVLETNGGSKSPKAVPDVHATTEQEEPKKDTAVSGKNSLRGKDDHPLKTNGGSKLPKAVPKERATREQVAPQQVTASSSKKSTQHNLNANIAGSSLAPIVRGGQEIKALNAKVNNLERQLKDKQLMLQQLSKLNIELQSTVINGFETLKAAVGDLCVLKASAGAPQLDMAAELYPVGYKRQTDKMVHLGRNVWIPGESWDSILTSKTPSLFVKYMATAVYGTAVLKASSVTGATSNRRKKADGIVSKPRLDPRKLMAIRDIFRYWLTEEKKLDEVSIDMHLKETGVYIGRKIADLIRQPKNCEEPLAANFLDVAMENNINKEVLDANLLSEDILDQELLDEEALDMLSNSNEYAAISMEGDLYFPPASPDSGE